MSLNEFQMLIRILFCHFRYFELVALLLLLGMGFLHLVELPKGNF